MWERVGLIRSAEFVTSSELLYAVQYAERVLCRIYKLIQLYRTVPCGVSLLTYIYL